MRIEFEDEIKEMERKAFMIPGCLNIPEDLTDICGVCGEDMGIRDVICKNCGASYWEVNGSWIC